MADVLDASLPAVPCKRSQQWRLDVQTALNREESALLHASRVSAKDAAAVALARAIADSISGPVHAAHSFPSDANALADDIVSASSNVIASCASSDSQARASNDSLRHQATSPHVARSVSVVRGSVREDSGPLESGRPSEPSVALVEAPFVDESAEGRASCPAAGHVISKCCSWRSDAPHSPRERSLDKLGSLAAREAPLEGGPDGSLPPSPRRASLAAFRVTAAGDSARASTSAAAPRASAPAAGARSHGAEAPPRSAEAPGDAAGPATPLGRVSDAGGRLSVAWEEEGSYLRWGALTERLKGLEGLSLGAVASAPTRARRAVSSQDDVPWSTGEILRRGYSTLCAVACQWDLINSIKLDQMLQRKSLIIMGYTLVQRNRQLDALGINFSKLLSFFTAVQELYTDAPYHNARHATHVIWAAHSLLYMTKLAYVLQPLEMMAMYVAAACHDVGHKGANSAFQLRTRARSTLIFEQSPIENCHLALTSLLVDLSVNDFLESLRTAERSEFLALIRRLILGTDLALHGQIVDEWRRRLDRLRELAGRASEASAVARGLPPLPPPLSPARLTCTGAEQAAGAPRAPARALHQLNMDAVSDRELALMMLLKAADLSHTAVRTDVHLCWVARLEEEMWCQGDMEKAQELEVAGEVFDRSSGVGLQSSQVSFFESFVLPQYELFSEVFADTTRVLRLAQANHQHWVDKAEAG